MMVNRATLQHRARASINKTAIMMIAVNRVDTSKTNIITINIMTKAALRWGTIKMGMGMSKPKAYHTAIPNILSIARSLDAPMTPKKTPRPSATSP
jgi:hypothetical protein